MIIFCGFMFALIVAFVVFVVTRIESARCSCCGADWFYKEDCIKHGGDK